jgi:DamX protein
MPPESGPSNGYFETPARAERLQLLQHLIRNAGEIIYLRAPAGAGKTLFAHRLLDALGDSYVGIWIRGGIDKDVASVAVAQLGLDDSYSLHWPKGILNSVEDRELLVVVDDADQLDLAAIERLTMMHTSGGRLLFLGHGGLASASGEWDVQFVDLPPFSVDESVAFLRARAGDSAGRISDDLAGFLHHSAHGRPGPLLAELEDVLARKPETRAAPKLAAPQRWAWWLAGAVGAAAIAAVLLNQDRINAWFAAGDADQGVPAERETEDSIAPIAGDVHDIARPAVTVPADEPPRDLVLSRPAETVPPITLPELSRPTTAGPVAKDAPEAAADDPLDAVMRDAIKAATQETATQGDAGSAGKGPDAMAAGIDGSGMDTQATGAADVERDGAAEALVEAATPVLGPVVPQPATGDEAVLSQGVVEGRGPTVADVTRPAAAPEIGPAPNAAAKPEKPRPAAGSPPSSGGVEWLKSRDPGRYTLQLIGARDRAAIEKYVGEHGVKAPYAIFARPLNGRPWYSLVAGDYADRDAAVAARSRLPRSLSRSDIWPRSFASVQETLR